VNEPVEIFNGGTGFMLIKREVFEKLGEKVPSYTNDVGDLSGQLNGAEKIREYFATSIEPETNRLLSEDYHFCREWRLAGGQVWAAPWAHLGHMGSYLFEGALIPAA
jgi:GT2 family glycosyltransferase